MPLRSPLPLAILVWAASALAPGAARAELARPTFEIHGFGELQVRSLGRNFDTDQFVPSQWAHVLDLELESDLAPDGIGPFELLSAFARVEVRYDCIYNGCGVAPTDIWWGNSARRAPRNLAGGRENPFSGELRVKSDARLQRDNHLGDWQIAMPLGDIAKLSPVDANGQTAADRTFAPISDARFTVKQIDATIGKGRFPMGPWNLDAEIEEVGSLRNVESPTLPLPMRPLVPAANSGHGLSPHGLFVPSDAFLRLQHEFDDPEQELSQTDLSWNHGQGQDERELKELYLDLEMFEGRLWIRVGKQSIVWGKTELFRTTDQFNPQDLALSSLPSLEESRLSLWSARGTWSFYDVGPLEDLRLEVAFNFDDFEPLDLGRCGEPYTIWLVCGKTFGLWAHGFGGIGVAGEIRPDDPWDSLDDLEFGARLEWRWSRFSFQISDFYGYEDAPVIDSFSQYERRVDPLSGQPLDTRGRPLLPTQSPEEILRLSTGNRQLFDVVCSLTVGIAGTLLPALANNCLLDLVNAQAEVLPIPGSTPAAALGSVLSGSGTGEFVASLLSGGTAVDLSELNQDPDDGPDTGGFLGAVPLSGYLTDQQEALLGCGPFYDTDCDSDGIDLYNAEASALVQSFPQFPAGGAVATRRVQGLPAVLPGARGEGQDINRNGVPDLIDPAVPVELRYSPLVDGCTGPGVAGCEASHELIDPRTGQRFPSEMAALSYNFMALLAAMSAGTGNDPDCDPGDPVTCSLVRGLFDVAGSTRPEVKAGGNGEFGRRDFIWMGGAEVAFRYEKRNVLGFAFDFAEDRTKTNWSVEATWMHDQPWAVVDRPHGFDKNDTWNLTVSVDRPTFINFLNPNRTFFVNSQWFVRYIDDYRDGGYAAHGPFSALGTLAVVTGYHQDRLLPALTWVHDIRSTSGGVIGQVTFRFTTELSATVGMAAFYGEPEPLPVSVRQPVASNLGGNFKANIRYDGLVPLAERDEIYMLIRYTF